ncbi:hypothetical protein AWENTII_008877 [Aspergillus wentii]
MFVFQAKAEHDIIECKAEVTRLTEAFNSHRDRISNQLGLEMNAISPQQSIDIHEFATVSFIKEAPPTSSMIWKMVVCAVIVFAVQPAYYGDKLLTRRIGFTMLDLATFLWNTQSSIWWVGFVKRPGKIDGGGC